MNVHTIALALIDRPANPHRVGFNDDDMAQLMRSISTDGLMQPIVVQPVNGRYQIIAGDRRAEAFRRLGLAEIPCNVLEPEDAAHSEVLTAIENLVRSDLSPMEEALYVTRMMDEHKLTAETIGKALKRSVDWVRQRYELMQIPEELQPLVHQRNLPIAVALLLADVTDPQHRAYLTRYAIDGGASAGVIRDWVRQWKLESEINPGAAPTVPEYTPGELPVMQMPCAACGDATRHDHLHIVRVCGGCHAELESALRDTMQAAQLQAETDHG